MLTKASTTHRKTHTLNNNNYERPLLSFVCDGVLSCWLLRICTHAHTHTPTHTTHAHIHPHPNRVWRSVSDVSAFVGLHEANTRALVQLKHALFDRFGPTHRHTGTHVKTHTHINSIDTHTHTSTDTHTGAHMHHASQTQKGQLLITDVKCFLPHTHTHTHTQKGMGKGTKRLGGGDVVKRLDFGGFQLTAGGLSPGVGSKEKLKRIHFTEQQRHKQLEGLKAAASAPAGTGAQKILVRRLEQATQGQLGTPPRPRLKKEVQQQARPGQSHQHQPQQRKQLQPQQQPQQQQHQHSKQLNSHSPLANKQHKKVQPTQQHQPAMQPRPQLNLSPQKGSGAKSMKPGDASQPRGQLAIGGGEQKRVAKRKENNDIDDGDERGQCVEGERKAALKKDAKKGKMEHEEEEEDDDDDDDDDDDEKEKEDDDADDDDGEDEGEGEEGKEGQGEKEKEGGATKPKLGQKTSKSPQPLEQAQREQQREKASASASPVPELAPLLAVQAQMSELMGMVKGVMEQQQTLQQAWERERAQWGVEKAEFMRNVREMSPRPAPTEHRDKGGVGGTPEGKAASLGGEAGPRDEAAAAAKQPAARQEDEGRPTTIGEPSTSSGQGQEPPASDQSADFDFDMGGDDSPWEDGAQPLGVPHEAAVPATVQTVPRTAVAAAAATAKQSAAMEADGRKHTLSTAGGQAASLEHRATTPKQSADFDLGIERDARPDRNGVGDPHEAAVPATVQTGPRTAVTAAAKQPVVSIQADQRDRGQAPSEGGMSAVYQSGDFDLDLCGEASPWEGGQREGAATDLEAILNASLSRAEVDDLDIPDNDGGGLDGWAGLEVDPIYIDDATLARTAAELGLQMGAHFYEDAAEIDNAHAAIQKHSERQRKRVNKLKIGEFELPTGA